MRSRGNASLAYILTLPGERAAEGAHIVELVIRQLEVERDWLAELLSGRSTNEGLAVRDRARPGEAPLKRHFRIATAFVLPQGCASTPSRH